MRVKRLAFMVVIIVTLGGCGLNCNYNGKVYNSSDKAMKAYSKDLNDRLEKIKQTDKHIGGKALVALPNATILEETCSAGVKENWPDVNPRDSFYRKRIAYTVLRADAHYGFMADAVKKRGIFDDVTVIRSDAPEKADISGYDYLIYLSVSGPYKDQWYLRFGKNAPMPIYLDYSIERSPERDIRRTTSWLTTIEQLVSEVK